MEVLVAVPLSRMVFTMRFDQPNSGYFQSSLACIGTTSLSRQYQGRGLCTQERGRLGAPISAAPMAWSAAPIAGPMAVRTAVTVVIGGRWGVGGIGHPDCRVDGGCCAPRCAVVHFCWGLPSFFSFFRSKFNQHLNN